MPRSVRFISLVALVLCALPADAQVLTCLPASATPVIQSVGGTPVVPGPAIEKSVERTHVSPVLVPRGTASGTPVIDDGYDGTLASMTCCTITVPDVFGGKVLDDLDAQVIVNTTWVGDVTIKIASPDGTVVTILNRPGSAVPDDGTDSPFVDSSDWIGDVITFNDESGGPSAEAMGANLPGNGLICTNDGICSFVPAPDTASGGGLSDFYGMDPAGDWRVCVGDGAIGEPTFFHSASLVPRRIYVELQSFTIE